MKELSIEDKAKRYDEAIKKGKQIQNTPYTAHWDIMKEVAEYLLPELKESEDEKAFKEMLQELKDSEDSIILTPLKRERWISCLEKQIEQILANSAKTCKDEQKPTDKVEPKFHEDEWVVTDKNNIVQIKAVENGKYVLENTMRFTVDYVDKCWRKWTIQDAKAGDILADDYGIYIFDEFDKDDERCFLCIGAYQYSQKVYEYERMLCSIDVRPATKEQRDLLFQKMKEAGYKWDTKKKELEKIEQNPDWSEEDEKGLGDALWCCKQAASIAKDENDMGNAWYAENWLKSLKERYTWKLSEE